MSLKISPYFTPHYHQNMPQLVSPYFSNPQKTPQSTPSEEPLRTCRLCQEALYQERAFECNYCGAQYHQTCVHYRLPLGASQTQMYCVHCLKSTATLEGTRWVYDGITPLQNQVADEW